MRVLVTGAAGFIGSNLVDRLLTDGHQVIGIDNLSTGSAANLASAMKCNTLQPRRFSFVKLDVQAPELADLVAGTNPDVVFHLAAQVDVRVSVADPRLDARTNVLGTINLCEAARQAGVRKIVYAASGGSRYGAPEALPVDEGTPLNPLSPYGVAKLAGELYLGAYAQLYGIDSICLALGNVYGPRQNPHGEAGVVTIFGSAMIAGRRVTIYGDGSAARDYVYVGDVVEAFALAGKAPAGLSGTYNIGTGEQVTVSEVHRMFSALLEGSQPPRHAAARTGDLQAIALDPGKAEAALGWKPSVGIAEGIEHTIRWLRETLESDPAELVGA